MNDQISKQSMTEYLLNSVVVNLQNAKECDYITLHPEAVKEPRYRDDYYILSSPEDNWYIRAFEDLHILAFVDSSIPLQAMSMDIIQAQNHEDQPNQKRITHVIDRLKRYMKQNHLSLNS